MATNAEIARKLGVGHSTVSRMRTGQRIGSPEVLQRISVEYDIPLSDVVDRAVRARAGDVDPWVRMMGSLMDGAESTSDD